MKRGKEVKKGTGGRVRKGWNLRGRVKKTEVTNVFQEVETLRKEREILRRRKTRAPWPLSTTLEVGGPLFTKQVGEVRPPHTYHLLVLLLAMAGRGPTLGTAPPFLLLLLFNQGLGKRAERSRRLGRRTRVCGALLWSLSVSLCLETCCS